MQITGNNKSTIICLPVAGTADPTQLLMIAGLNHHQLLFAMNGIHDKFFGILRSAIKYKPQFIHFDWIDSYYFRRHILLTLPSILLFLLQLYICRYVLRIKLGWTIHNLTPHDKKKLKLRKFVQRRTASLMHFIRVFSPASIDAVSSLYHVQRNKVHFVGMGSYVGYYPDTISKAEARRHLHLPADSKVLLTLGSVKRYKGIPEYLEICKRINNENLIVLIAGKCMDDMLRKEIAMLTSEHIRFIDQFIPPGELQYYYHAADLVVLPFLDVENSGSVVMAMGYKKPIVAAHSNVVDFRLQYQTELLYASGNLEDTLNKALAYTDTQLEKMGEENFRQLDEAQWEDFGDLFIQTAQKQTVLPTD